MQALIKEQWGGDRRVARALAEVIGVSPFMTRSESQAMTELLGQIMESWGNGDMEQMVKGLVSKGQVSSKSHLALTNS